jgi:hypothetical protein
MWLDKPEAVLQFHVRQSPVLAGDRHAQLCGRQLHLDILVAVLRQDGHASAAPQA